MDDYHHQNSQATFLVVLEVPSSAVCITVYRSGVHYKSICRYFKRIFLNSIQHSFVLSLKCISPVNLTSLMTRSTRPLAASFESNPPHASQMFTYFLFLCFKFSYENRPVREREVGNHQSHPSSGFKRRNKTRSKSRF